MDAYEVTIGQYKKFIRETGHRSLPEWGSQISPTDNHPVVGTSWHDAEVYSRWAGKRLPTEAEWEYAARGGLEGEQYPWGETEPNGEKCNYADKNADATLRQMNASYNWADMQVDDGYALCAPVGSYPANGYGLYDIAGNVQEWCQDWYSEHYYSKFPVENPEGTASGEMRVIRGGSWSGDKNSLQVATRNRTDPMDRRMNHGFRCVSDPP